MLLMASCKSMTVAPRAMAITADALVVGVAASPDVHLDRDME